MLRWTVRILNLVLISGIVGAVGVLYALWYFGRDLPEYRMLEDYEPPIVTRVYAGNGLLIGEFAQERRVFVPFEVVPKRVVDAFVAAEDQHYFRHPGVDFLGMARAAITNLRNLGGDRRPVGASTITQQVAKNFLLSNELSFARKIREIILAFRIERAFTKEHILELYLNEIFLGMRSYGVAAAALTYFGKALDELSVGEAAYLAALPKAPANYHPTRHPEAAVKRRNYVIQRMFEDGYVTVAEAAEAQAAPLVVRGSRRTRAVGGRYFVEEVRRQLLERYGDEALWRGGLVVRSTLDPRLQDIADRALRMGLIAYDRRHGWRGPLSRIPPDADWALELARTPPLAGLGDWRLAAVLGVDARGAEIGFADGGFGRIPLAELRWARAWKPGQKLGPKVGDPSQVLKLGDVIAVERMEADAEREPYPDDTYGLRQLPEVQGGIVALDPHSGRVLAMSGGFSFAMSQFNRAIQAQRQPGSAFKPFVYLAALEQGFTPATIVLDAPVVIKSELLGKWKPENYSRKFYGPIPMRVGIEKSRNLMTVRLAQDIGVGTIADYGQRFGISDELPLELGMALGSSETTLFKLTVAYAMLVNGGKRITPTLIDRIQDRYGKTVFRHDIRDCEDCGDQEYERQDVPSIRDYRDTLADPLSVYQIVSMLRGVVQRGTGWRVKAVGKPISGKTGTTNEFFDAWFIGFTPDLVAGVWVGFDQPQTLGRNETGSRAAAPIFTDFMKAALAERPAVPFRIPEGIKLVRVNAATGRPARPGDALVITEAFKVDTDPRYARRAPTRWAPGVVRGAAPRRPGPAAGTGGLY